MLEFGQIIMTYPYGETRWVTIWSLNKLERREVLDVYYPPLAINQFVSFKRASGDRLYDLKVIDKADLPKNFELGCI